MTHPKKIAVLGSVNLDLIITTQDLPKAGQTIGGGAYQALPGGKGANVALGVKRLGGYALLLAAVGSDDFAQQALETLKEEAVDLSQIVRKEKHHTGLAFINVDAKGENQIAVASGANGALLDEDIAPIRADALISQFEVPLETTLAVFKRFSGFKVLNASPVTLDADEILSESDLVIVNEGEFAVYKLALKNHPDWVAITLGAEGAVLMKAGKEVARSKPPKVQVVDTTGAGDCFCAALTLALTEEMTPQKALDFACTAGALATTKLGAQGAIPLRKAVDRSIK